MTKTTYVFEGTMSAIEPLTVTIPVAASLKSLKGLLPRNGGPDADAYWPATTIRGSLRHCAHAVALAYTKRTQNENPFDLADHFLLAQGVDIVGDAAVTEGGLVDSEQAIQAGNPLLSLFGYWGLASKANIGNAFPLQERSTGMFGGGARGIMFERNAELLEELDESQQARLDNILIEQSLASADAQVIKKQQAELKKKLRTASEADKKAIFDELGLLDKELSARKDKKTEARESIRRPLEQYEAIVAGCDMSHRMSLKSATDVELGFFLATLLQFARNPRMGGHQNHNCGLVKAQYTVKTWPEDAMIPVDVGTVSFSDEGFNIEGDTLKKAYQSWIDSEHVSFKKNAHLASE